MNYLPAVMQTESAEKMSSRYVHVNTMDVIDIMRNEGFVVADQKVSKTRKSDPAFARHSVVFRSEELGQSSDTFVPQAIFTNSHNGSTTAEFKLGLYRFVCANGLVVGNTYANASIKHIGDLARQVIDRIKEMSKETSRVFSKIDEWNKIDLDKSKRASFAEQAMELRFGDKAKQYDFMDVLKARRLEDDAGDLWSTYNIIQENTTKGGLVGRNANNRQIRSKDLKAIAQDLKFNTELWNLAESFA